MEITLDKQTLPADGELVRFRTWGNQWHEGEYVAKTNQFIEVPELSYSAWIVIEWESINKSVHTKSNQNEN
jgi:hypothetical protein